MTNFFLICFRWPPARGRKPRDIPRLWRSGANGRFYWANLRISAETYKHTFAFLGYLGVWGVCSVFPPPPQTSFCRWQRPAQRRGRKYWGGRKNYCGERKNFRGEKSDLCRNSCAYCSGQAGRAGPWRAGDAASGSRSARCGRTHWREKGGFALSFAYFPLILQKFSAESTPQKAICSIVYGRKVTL